MPSGCHSNLGAPAQPGNRAAGSASSRCPHAGSTRSAASGSRPRVRWSGVSVWSGPGGTMVKPRYKGRSTINPSRASTNPGTLGVAILNVSLSHRNGPDRIVPAGSNSAFFPQIAWLARAGTTCGTEPPSAALTCTGRRSGGERGRARCCVVQCPCPLCAVVGSHAWGRCSAFVWWQCLVSGLICGMV